jgi:hypothetical protein
LRFRSPRGCITRRDRESRFSPRFWPAGRCNLYQSQPARNYILPEISDLIEIRFGSGFRAMHNEAEMSAQRKHQAAFRGRGLCPGVPKVPVLAPKNKNAKQTQQITENKGSA